MKALGMLHGTPLYRFFHREAEAELALDVRLAARAMARRRQELGREPVRAVARQICDEMGIPVPPALNPAFSYQTESRPHGASLRRPASGDQ